jgi:hypothetical protein
MFLPRLILGALVAGLAIPASAAVTVTFYSRDFGERFPHAFVKVEGVMDAGGEPVDANYGFTAKAVTPAILLGSVGGEIVSMSDGYVAKADAQMSFPLSDAEYERLIGIVLKWQAKASPSYNLNRANCVHFAADAARAVGLDAPDMKPLMKKPKSFLIAVRERNGDWLATRAATGAPAEPASGPVARPYGEKRDGLTPERVPTATEKAAAEAR